MGCLTTLLKKKLHIMLTIKAQRNCTSTNRLHYAYEKNNVFKRLHYALRPSLNPRSTIF